MLQNPTTTIRIRCAGAEKHLKYVAQEARGSGAENPGWEGNAVRLPEFGDD